MPEGVWINGRVLAELRALAGMDQVDLANASCVYTAGCKLTETKVSAYEREEVRPTTGNLNAMLEALERAWTTHGLAFGQAERRALICTPTLDAATANGRATKEDPSDRRTAGKLLVVGSLSAMFAPSDALERITTHGDRPVDAALIADHEDVGDSLAARHMTTRPDVLVGPVARHADMLEALLGRETTTSTVRARVDAAMVDSSAQAGLLAFLSGKRRVARHYFSLARTIAEDSGEDTLLAKALGAASSMYSPIPTGGRGGDVRLAVDMLRRATHLLRTAGPDLCAWAYRELGTELAAARDEQGFREAMQTAERLAAQPARQDGRGFFARYAADLNDKEAIQDEGGGYVVLGRPDRALEALSAVAVEGSPRRHVRVLAEIAGVRVLQGEAEQACHELAFAAGLAIGAGYQMGIERIRGVRARFDPHWAGLPCVIELDEQLHAAIPRIVQS